MIDLDEIRKEVAMKHDVLLDKNDPTLVSLSLNEAVLSRYVELLNEQNEQHLKATINAMQQGLAEAKVTASKIVNDGGRFVSDQANVAVTAAMEEGREEIRKDLRLAWTKIEAARKAAYVAAGISGICALITFSAMMA